MFQYKHDKYYKLTYMYIETLITQTITANPFTYPLYKYDIYTFPPTGARIDDHYHQVPETTHANHAPTIMKWP